MAERADLRLLRLLSAEESRSGEAIAAALGCSRAAVWKHVEALRELGVAIEAAAGTGYRLAEPMELLDQAGILSAIDPGARGFLRSLEVFPALDSTNAELQRRPAEEQHAAVVLAERQTMGRGRRGRAWFSPFACNLYLSLGWRFDAAAGELASLPLVVALAAGEALARSGIGDHAVKWPNDLLLDGRKLGGCLVELQGDASGPCGAVMGIGINVRMGESTAGAEAIGQPWSDLAARAPGLSRNALAAKVVSALAASVARYERSGFGPFMDAWRQRDWLAGRQVEVARGDGLVRGTARGISARGALLLDTGTGVQEFHAGEVTVRA